MQFESEGQQSEEPLLVVEQLQVWFGGRFASWPRSKQPVHAVDGVSLGLNKGRTMGLVGESGSGKSTLARAVARLLNPTAGKIMFKGIDIAALSQKDLRAVRRHLQIIFQDPYASLNPRRRVGDIIRAPLNVHKRGTTAERDSAVEELLGLVGLPMRAADRLPSEFSGGQMQRINIARALALRPEIIICDEPTSALDVSIQAQILNLLVDLRERYDLSYLFISHDLSVVRFMADHIAVMYAGQIVEMGSADTVFSAPRHPYTIALLSAMPSALLGDVSSQRVVLEGEPVDPSNMPTGCRFHPRCPIATSRCTYETQELQPVTSEHVVACWRWDTAPNLLRSTPTSPMDSDSVDIDG